MPIPTFDDVTSSLFDGNNGAFRARSDTGKGGLKFNTKSANGFKFEADGTFGAKSNTSFSFTYPKLGFKKFTGDLKVTGKVAGNADSYKIAYKKLNLKKAGSLDLKYDMSKNNLNAKLTSKQDKFTLQAAVNVPTKASDKKVNGNVSAVVGDGDTNFGVNVGFDLNGEAKNRMVSVLGYPEFAAAYRPADGTELFFRSKGNLPFMKKGPALEIDLGATCVVDAENTVSFAYGLNAGAAELSKTGAKVAGTRKIGDDTLEYCLDAEGGFSGSYSTNLASRVTGNLHFANDLSTLSLDGTAFGYSVEFA